MLTASFSRCWQQCSRWHREAWSDGTSLLPTAWALQVWEPLALPHSHCSQWEPCQHLQWAQGQAQGKSSLQVIPAFLTQVITCHKAIHRNAKAFPTNSWWKTWPGWGSWQPKSLQKSTLAPAWLVVLTPWCMDVSVIPAQLPFSFNLNLLKKKRK